MRLKLESRKRRWKTIIMAWYGNSTTIVRIVGWLAPSFSTVWRQEARHVDEILDQSSQKTNFETAKLRHEKIWRTERFENYQTNQAVL